MNFLGILFVTMIASVPVINHFNEGDYCVGAGVQEGNLVQTKDNRRMQVVKIHGKSVFCNTELPIRAELATQE